MAVTFYPSKPIELLEKYIIKDDGSPLYGEIDIYRQLHFELSNVEDEWHVWHDLRLPTHSEKFNKYKKTSCQIDFLILCTEGLLVLEVKGGQVSLKDNTFFYGREFETKMDQNPFFQAEGYKHTLKDKILNNITKCFFCHAVAFPHVDYKFESRIFDNNILWSKYSSKVYKSSILKFIYAVFRYGKAEHKKYNRIYQDLGRREIDSVRKVLSPIVNDKCTFNNINTLEWLQIANLEILESLSKNKRIMIEGPPGSGKTTIARAYIDQQFQKKGLYICWNQLLMHHTKDLIQKRMINEVEVTTLTRFLIKLNPSISGEKLNTSSESEFYTALKQTIELLENKSALPSYDYIIVDESQDVFDRGIV